MERSIERSMERMSSVSDHTPQTSTGPRITIAADNESQAESHSSTASATPTATSTMPRRGPHPLIHQASLQQTGQRVRRKKSEYYVRPQSVMMPIAPSADNSVGVSVFEPDESSVNTRTLRLSARTTRIIGTIMVWLKNVNKLRTIAICKAFYHWKCVALTLVAVSSHNNATSHTTSASTSAEDASPLTEQEREEQEQAREREQRREEQKSSFLQLFAENERLRDQLAELRLQSAQQNKALRTQATRSVLTTLAHKWSSTKVRHYFDSWYHNARMLKLVAETQQRSVELAVGLQEIESEREFVRLTQTTNSSLSMMLSLTVYFLKWKSRTNALLLQEERTRFEHQRNTIFQELRKMRKLVNLANTQESAVLHSAIQRGDDTTQQLTEVRDRLAQLVQSSKTYSSTPLNADLLANLLNTYVRNKPAANKTHTTLPVAGTAAAQTSDESVTVGSGSKQTSRRPTPESRRPGTRKVSNGSIASAASLSGSNNATLTGSNYNNTSSSAVALGTQQNQSGIQTPPPPPPPPLTLQNIG